MNKLRHSFTLAALFIGSKRERIYCIVFVPWRRDQICPFNDEAGKADLPRVRGYPGRIKPNGSDHDGQWQ